MIIILSPFDVDVVKTTLILNLDDVDIFSEHKAKLPFFRLCIALHFQRAYLGFSKLGKLLKNDTQSSKHDVTTRAKNKLER